MNLAKLCISQKTIILLILSSLFSAVVMTHGHKHVSMSRAPGGDSLVSAILFGSLIKPARRSSVYPQDHGLAKFAVKCQIANILVFMDHRVSITTTQLSCGAKTATDNRQTNECDCVPIKFYLQNQAGGQIWLIGHTLLFAHTQGLPRTTQPMGCGKKLMYAKHWTE